MRAEKQLAARKLATLKLAGRTAPNEEVMAMESELQNIQEANTGILHVSLFLARFDV